MNRLGLLSLVVCVATAVAGSEARADGTGASERRTPLPAAYPVSELPMSVTAAPDGLDLTEPDAPGVTVERIGDAIRVAYNGAAAASIPLCEAVRPETDGTFACIAEIRGVELGAPAYLELWCVDGEQAWFSRALADQVAGPTEWKRAVARFRADTAPDAVVMGVRFEGPGAVELRRISLVGDANQRYAWLPGTLMGVMAGAWGGLCGLLAPRGKGRRAVLALGFAILACALALAAHGVQGLVHGAPYATWYPSLLPGIVGTTVLGSLLPVIRARYAAHEAGRIAAREQSESLR